MNTHGNTIKRTFGLVKLFWLGDRKWVAWGWLSLVLAMLVGISISPVDATHLAEKDRMPFLSYVHQICALAEIPAKKPFYLSSNADVWRILRVNFKESVPSFDDPAIVHDEPGNPPVKMVNVKAIAPKVLKLVP